MDADLCIKVSLEGRGYAHRLLDKTSWHRKRNGIFMKEQVTDWTPYFKNLWSILGRAKRQSRARGNLCKNKR